MGPLIFLCSALAVLIAVVILSLERLRSRQAERTFHQLREIRVGLMNIDERLQAVKSQLNAGLGSITESLANIFGDIQRLKDAVHADQPKETTLADLEALGARMAEVTHTASEIAAIEPEPAPEVTPAEPPAPVVGGPEADVPPADATQLPLNEPFE